MTFLPRPALVIAIAMAANIGLANADAGAAGMVLSGAVVSVGGEKMGGVTVSAKAGTITTTVFTDQSGEYVFPPLPAGHYRIWAQALTFATAKAEIDLGPSRHQDFSLQPLPDFVRQLPGDAILAALPGANAEDARMKTLVRKNCTGCHTASYPLQHRFDEAGWNAVLDLMKHVNVLGTYQGPEHKPNGNIEFHQKELAAYLARARGPGPSSMIFNLRPRPAGEAARVVFKEYDVPLEPDTGSSEILEPSNDGSDWSLGTPSGTNGRYGVHDAVADFDGNLWFTYSFPSREITVARIDVKNGTVKNFKLNDAKGFAMQTHGITRDEKGILWFNTRSATVRGHGGLARLDPRSEKITVYLPPPPMSGTAGTLDVDGKGYIWVTSPDGALRFDPEAEKFTEFKSITYKAANGATATVYGLAGDREGNGWWLLMTHDLVDKGDITTGKTTELKLPPEQAAIDLLTPDERKMYETFAPPDFNTPFPWAQAPRRMGADKNADFVWVGDSFGGNLAKIDIHTHETTLIPLPNPEAHQPYEVAIDKDHNVRTNLWSSDQIAKYDQGTSQWTLFELPTRGTETRYISLLEKDGAMQVVLPYSRTRKVAVMTLRSEADIAALKAQVSAQ